MGRVVVGARSEWRLVVGGLRDGQHLLRGHSADAAWNLSGRGDFPAAGAEVWLELAADR